MSVYPSKLTIEQSLVYPMVIVQGCRNVLKLGGDVIRGHDQILSDFQKSSKLGGDVSPRLPMFR